MSIHYSGSVATRCVGRSIGPVAALALAWVLAGAGFLALAGWPDVAQLQPPSSLAALELLFRSPDPPLEGLLQVAGLIFSLVWIWVGLSVAVETVLGVLEVASAQSATVVSRVRRVTNRLTFPLARRAVAAALLVQVVARPATLTFASSSSAGSIIVTRSAGADFPDPVVADSAHVTSFLRSQTVEQEQASAKRYVAQHVVRRGDTLWSIAERYYGTGEEFDRLVDANIGRRMEDRRVFDRAGLIYPGWTLEVPLASEDQEGAHWYVVRRGDTLRGIAARLLDNEEKYVDLFELNVGSARVGDNGPVLRTPDLIWPGLRLRLPAELDSPPEVEQVIPAAAASTVSDAATDQGELLSPSVPDLPPNSPPAVAQTTTPVPPMDTLPTAIPVATVVPVLTSTPPASKGSVPHDQGMQPHVAAALAGGGAITAAAVGALVVRRRRPAPPFRPDSSVSVRDGFAAADPVVGLARRLAHTVDPAAAVAALLSRAYAEVFAEQLSDDQRQEALYGLQLVATRHGETSTTLTIAAPVAARPHLIHKMEAAVARAFGEHTDTDGQVSRDGDVLVRVTWHPRHPVPAHLLDRLPVEKEATAWPSPFLVPLIVLYDRQELSVNWHSLTNLLVAAPLGDGAEPIVSGLIAALASARSPEELGLIIIASPHSVPNELPEFPHVLIDPADSNSGESVDSALDALQAELGRRVVATDSGDGDIILLVRELVDLEPGPLSKLAAIAARGPQFGIRVVAATDRPVPELLQKCSFLDEFGARIVRATADEDESVALLGMTGAEELPSGGHVLVRLEGRAPIQAWARRVPGDHLARLLRMMGTRVRTSTHPVVAASDQVADDQEVGVSEPIEPRAVAEVTETVEVRSACAASEDTWSTPLIQQLRAAPIRVQCFGARNVRYRDRLLWPNGEAEADKSWELFILLAAHRITGVQSESLVDMIWGDETPRDTARALRQRRWRAREELRRLAPELVGEAMPTDASRNTSQVYSLNPSVVRSDVHLFLELIQHAKSLGSADAIQAYEEALALYRGDLLESSDVPNYPWLYDGESIALTLRSDYRRQHHDARLHLADLLAAGPADGLPRAAELYIELCGEEPEDERLWIALFRVHERAGDVLGLDSSVRQLRSALCELATGETDRDSVSIPPNLERSILQIRASIVGKQVDVSR
jgi:nucleoid-associated protein YgaU